MPFLAIGMLMACALVAACGGGSSESQGAPSSSGPEPASSVQSLPLPSPTPGAGAAGDGPTGPGPQPGVACPVALVLCEFAVQLEAAFEAGDADALLALARPVEVACPDQPGTGVASASLCEGAAPGEKRQGYWALQGGEGRVVSEAELRAGLARWFDAIARHSEAADVYGPGELRIGSITCTRKPDQPKGFCLGNSVQIHFTFINPQEVDGTGLPGQRISFHVSASVRQEGPRMNGFGTVVPPNSVLVPRMLEVPDTDGNPLVAEVYPWTH